MDSETLSKLRRPFDRSVIKQRVGPAGRTLSYVPICEYIERLIEAFGGEFSISVTNHEVLEEEVLVEVRIEAGCTVKTAIGGAAITRRRDSGKPVSLACDMQAAEARGTKRACRGFGIGLDLYDDDADESERAEPSQQLRPVPPSVQGGGRITSAQLGKIRELLTETGDDLAAFKAAVRDAHGVTLEYLDKRAGSRVIEELLAKSRRLRTNGSTPAERRAL